MDEIRGRINNALDLVAQSSNFNLPQSLSAVTRRYDERSSVQVPAGNW